MRGTGPLLPVAIGHGVAAIACAALLALELAPIAGGHPAVKPLKFAVSIAVLLVSMHLVLDALAADPRLKALLGWVLAVTMVVEMAVIALQAARGVTSHFNTSTPLDAFLWSVMGGMVVVATLALLATALLASTHRLAFSPLVSTAVRIGLWLLLLVAVSGFAMGGRGSHAVGAAADASAALPGTGWSTTHGDLRVPHFVALHGLQALPLVALLFERTPLAERDRWIGFGVIAAAWCVVSIGTLAQALGGRPLWSGG